MCDLETREVCSDSTQLDISYATFYEGNLPRYGRYDYLVVPENAVVICDE